MLRAPRVRCLRGVRGASGAYVACEDNRNDLSKSRDEEARDDGPAACSEASPISSRTLAFTLPTEGCCSRSPSSGRCISACGRAVETPCTQERETDAWPRSLNAAPVNKEMKYHVTRWAGQRLKRRTVARQGRSAGKHSLRFPVIMATGMDHISKIVR